jgi:hypothetical protein
VGTIVHGQSYLSNDKTAIYTEMHVKIGKVLYNKSPHAISAGTDIDVTRMGGAVRMPTGRFLIRGCPQETMPHTGLQYLLVLQYTDQLDDFPLMAAYELRGDRVYLLEEPQSTVQASVASTNTQASRPAKRNFVLQEYGSPENSFLNNVTAAISQLPAN